jgi:uncharacterized membrane protein
MADAPVQLIVAAFNDERAADNALKALKEAARNKVISVANAAVLRKDSNGKLHIKETADLTGKRAAIGGAAGAAIGLIAGPALVVPAAVGALIGGLSAKLKDRGFSDDRLKKLGEGLKPSSSAIVAVVEHTWVEEAKAAVASEAADVFVEGLSEDIASQLQKDHNVAYTAIASEAGVAMGRVSAGEKEVEAEAVVITEDEVVGSVFVATEEGVEVKPKE